MKLNNKVTGGLAWAGLFLILAVPSVDILTKPSVFQAGTGEAVDEGAVSSGAEPAKSAAIVAPRPATRSIAPAAPAATDDPVESYVASGKPLPSYISDAPAADKVATAPAAPAAPATTKKIITPSAPQAAEVKSDGTFANGTDQITTASVETVQLTPPPQPYPASMRPTGRSSTTTTSGRQPLVIDEDPLAREEVAAQSVEPFAPRIIDDEDLEEWDSGSLADFLERRGLISDSDRAVRSLESEFDEDGFFLSDGPNSRARLIGRYRDGGDLF